MPVAAQISPNTEITPTAERPLAIGSISDSRSSLPAPDCSGSRSKRPSITHSRRPSSVSRTPTTETTRIASGKSEKKT